MSLKGKLNRKAVKAITKAIEPQVKMRNAARLIVTSNSWRIFSYCQTYYLPLFAWVMYKHYGFGFRRLAASGTVNIIFPMLRSFLPIKPNNFLKNHGLSVLCI